MQDGETAMQSNGNMTYAYEEISQLVITNYRFSEVHYFTKLILNCVLGEMSETKCFQFIFFTEHPPYFRMLI